MNAGMLMAIKPFQILMLPPLALAAVYCLWQWLVHRRPRQAIAALLLVCASFAVASPELTQRVANALGIGRGADLIIYLSALGLIGAYMLILHSNRKLRLELTELTRQLALRDLPQQHAPTRGPSESPTRGSQAA